MRTYGLQISFETKAFKKKGILLEEGKRCSSCFFVVKGCLRLFFTDHKGVEQTLQLALENWWITDYKTFCDGKPPVYAIAAMEDSEITFMSPKNYETLQLQFPFIGLVFQ
jgi:CRP-like cAMP-binding protein